MICTIFIVLQVVNHVTNNAPEGTLVHYVQTALNLGNSTLNYTREDCDWRKGNDQDACPDPDVKFILYTSKNPKDGEVVNMMQRDWLRTSSWDPLNNNVLLVHGYAGGDDKFPGVIVRDAYIKNGSYNVFVIDWGPLAKLPCYPAAVHNLRPVARCTAQLLYFIRDMGIDSRKTECVGHSLGAHICGLIGGYLHFRLHRVIGLDPARPLIRNSVKLKPGAAEVVQVIHTNAGTYGDGGKAGKVDFCVNGGKIQPVCQNRTNEELCSHILALCYLADSLDSTTAQRALPCTRRCPTLSRPTHRLGKPVLMGEHTPDEASGSYCVVQKTAPYCSKTPGGRGHPWCCLDRRAADDEITDIAPPLTPPEETLST